MIKVYFSKSLQGEKYIAVSCVKRNMLSFRFVDKSVKINQFINLNSSIKDEKINSLVCTLCSTEYSSYAFAQSGYKVKGHVVSAEDNEPMVGVSILEKGTTNGVITDIDGNYTLEIKGTASATLLFSYIGMQSQAHAVSAKTGTLNVRLVSDAALIDEVVVVAYGTRKKGRLLVPYPLLKRKNGKCACCRF